MERGAEAEDRMQADAWSRAAVDPVVDAAIRAIHADVAEATRAARPLCLASGRCCDFEAFGHRLYVTGLETAWCLAQVGRIPGSVEIAEATARGTCPFLVNRMCGIHTVRPFACRTFFCDRDATDWQRELHERCHATMRALHELHAIPYRYGEWRAMLALLGSERERR